ncbi:glycosyltransferase family 4 protein [Pontiella agarivorans]|uniref:Glycosyltransferase family 4 protein n=1 Tax=Pontiella agarivorans TaxID=3038953 RepID=A0ABU5MVX5_9BACT|nr:glycosyltransferase family 4 protein [Pontiella agarivorans]MDZ8118386.1 glycosyltransferase family 4 protein [Pontiella agarivorans]
MAKVEKVVHVMRRFTPEKWGGTESVVFSVSKELTRRKIVNRVFCTDMLAESGFHTLESVSVRRFSYCFPWLFLSRAARKKLELKGGSPLSLPLFFALLVEKDISVIHTHVQKRLGGMARTVARLKKIPYVVSLHGGCFSVPTEQLEKMTEPFRGKPEWGKAFGALFGSRRVLEDADAIICVGRNEADEARKRFPDKPVHYLPNGVDVRRFSEADGEAFRKKYGFRPREKIVLCVSRIDYQKNQLGLVRAFSAFAENHPDHRLVLIGPVTVEAYRDTLEKEIQTLGLSGRVTVIEGLSPLDPLLPSAYKAAEMFVLPSVHEPFGIVVLEAWAAGLPVVANRIGGIPGFVKHRETALLTEPGDDDALREGMEILAEDIALRSDLSRRAFGEVASTYDWSKVTDRLLAVYEEVIAVK